MRRTLLTIILYAATHAAFAQVPIVATHTLKPTANDLGDMPLYANVEFGAAVAIDGRRLAVGMTGYSNGAGRVGIYHRTAKRWRRTATLSPSNPDDDSFGSQLDIDGHILAVAARGAAYLFVEQDDGTWRQIGRVAAGNRDRTFETRVAYDNGIVALSRIGRDADGNDLPGNVYLYRRCAEHGLHPTPVARLRASDGFPGDRFGASLALERGVLVVGGPSAAYVFVRSTQGWAERQKLIGSTAGTEGAFGASVAIRDRVILAGAPTFDVPGGFAEDSPEGSGYVFLPDGGGWFESQVLNADGRFYQHFGQHVAMGRGMVAGVTPFEAATLSAWGTALVFDWVGQELRYGRPATKTPQGWRLMDIDMSGRTLVVGMNEYSWTSPNSFGRVTIVEFAEE